MIYCISSKPLQNVTFKFQGLNIFIHDECDFHLSDSEFVLLEGFIFDLVEKRQLKSYELITILQSIAETHEVLDERYTGQFNIIYLNHNEICIANDFSGNLPMFYKMDAEEIIVTNAESLLADLAKDLDKVAILQSLLGPSYTPYGNRSNYKEVNRLWAGQYIFYNYHTESKKQAIDSVKIENKRLHTTADIAKLDTVLKENAAIYTKIFEHVILPISGGVDSRITLSAINPVLDSSKSLALSYGSPIYIDNKIAKKLCDFIGIKHINVPFESSLFPTRIAMEQILKNGGEFFVSPWFTVIKAIEAKDLAKQKNVLLLGDVYDLLRAKNVRSTRSRNNRIRNAVSKLTGNSKDLAARNVSHFIAGLCAEFETALNKLKEQDSDLFNEIGMVEQDFLKASKKDIAFLVNYIDDKVQSAFQENLEEAYFAFTWGRKAMAKQATIFKGTCSSFVMMVNRHLVKQLLRIHPWDRSEDTLTHALLTLPQNRNLARFETSQIPFLPYKANMLTKYIFWATRFAIDRIIIKLNKQGFIKKERLVTHIEYFKYYKIAKNEENLHQILENHPLAAIPKRMFDRRKKGLQRSFAEPDILAFVYPIYLLNTEKIVLGETYTSNVT